MSSDIPLAPEDSTQVLSQKLIAPYLRENISIGITNSSTIFLNPSKDPSPTDKEFVFQFPEIYNYIDLNRIELYVKGKILVDESAGRYRALAPTDQACLVNNSLHSIFESVLVKVGVNQEKVYESMRPQKAFIRQLLRTKNVKASDLRCHGFANEYEAEHETAFKKAASRLSLFAESREVEYCGTTLIDLFQTDGMMTPNVPLQVTYRLANPEQYILMGENSLAANLKCFFAITKIGLRIPIVKINPTLTPLLETLTDKTPARFHFEGIDVRQFNLSTDTRQKTLIRVYNGKIPQKIVVAVYPQSAMIGNWKESCISTDIIHGVSSVRLILNGSVVRELDADFDADLYMIPFRACASWFDSGYKNHTLTYSNYKGGMRYFAFDLLDGCDTENCSDSLLQSGFLDIEIKFKTPLKGVHVLMAYCLSPDTLDIDQQRVARLNRAVL